MKKEILAGAILALLAASSARATLYTETFNGINTAIPDGNPVGVVFNGNVGDVPSDEAVASLTVSFEVSGGYDANLYAYLVAPNGTMVVLLDHPGVTSGNPFGNAGSGMNVTLADGAPDITASSTLSSGTYAAEGSLANFDGSAANGTWELFFADTVSGGGTSVLNGWSLGVTPVPEPVTIALPWFGILLGGFAVGGRIWRKRVAD